jgi:ATP-dependent Lhr-like helicase
VTLLREARRRPPTQQHIAVSGADPLNLIGILTPGARLPSLTGNRLLYVDGLPIATFAAGEVQFLEKLAPKEEWEAQNAVQRRHVPAALVALDGST